MTLFVVCEFLLVEYWLLVGFNLTNELISGRLFHLLLDLLQVTAASFSSVYNHSACSERHFPFFRVTDLLTNNISYLCIIYVRHWNVSISDWFMSQLFRSCFYQSDISFYNVFEWLAGLVHITENIPCVVQILSQYFFMANVVTCSTIAWHCRAWHASLFQTKC